MEIVQDLPHFSFSGRHAAASASNGVSRVDEGVDAAAGGQHPDEGLESDCPLTRCEKHHNEHHNNEYHQQQNDFAPEDANERDGHREAAVGWGR